MTLYPGSYAVPGSLQPGSAWPGDTLFSSAGTATFTGSVTLTYPQYLDVSTGKTLVAVPGGTYGIELGSGYPGPPDPIPDDGRWITGGG